MLDAMREIQVAIEEAHVKVVFLPDLWTSEGSRLCRPRGLTPQG